ncbi:hypothetical protein C0995_007330 [Termitomyces sp. Mi166|nr:hypothetical protein C0995_007330 [Termitomyces sp. Mi166\
MDVVSFPSNVPTRAGLGQMLFLHAMAIPAPPPQFAVVVVTTDPRTPEQYDGLVATQHKAVAAFKGKGKIVPTLSDESDYESEEESAAQRFQRVQYNKKLAAKKANKAKAEAALQHTAINDFSRRIPDRLEVWGPLDVERLNSCFTGALSDCIYYSVHNNAIFVRANANQAVAFEYSSQQRAKMPASVVYKFAPRSFPRTPYELEWLYKHYANEHAPHHDQVVTYLLINELLLVAQKLNESLLDKTMQALLHNPMYRDLQSPIQGDENKDFVEAVASYNAAFLDQLMVAQYGSHLNIIQVHMPNEMAQNFSDNNALRVLLHNQILLDWVDHAYTYGVVYLEQQFHNPTMSLDIFHKIDDEHHQRLLYYGTSSAIPQWDGWREISEDNHYCLLFKRNKEHFTRITRGQRPLLLYWYGPKPGLSLEAHSSSWSAAASTHCN